MGKERTVTAAGLMPEILAREIGFLWKLFSLQFFQIAPYWGFGMLLGSLISVFGKGKLHSLFESMKGRDSGAWGLVPASLVGIASPLCMYGTIPIAASFSKRGMDEGRLAAFMMSSILLNPQLLFYTAPLGTGILVIRFASCLLSGITAGLLVRYFFRGKSFFNFAGFNESDSDGNSVGKDGPAVRLLKSFLRNLKVTGAAFLLGISLSALFQRYVPEDAFAAVFGRHRAFGILMAASVGVPLYVCGGGTIPLLIAWMQSGMSIGSASAFMLTGPAMKISNLGAIKIVLGFRAFVLYIVFIVAFALALGFFIDFV